MSVLAEVGAWGGAIGSPVAIAISVGGFVLGWDPLADQVGVEADRQVQPDTWCSVMARSCITVAPVPGIACVYVSSPVAGSTFGWAVMLVPSRPPKSHGPTVSSSAVSS
jgi:hypothetical protein